MVLANSFRKKVLSTETTAAAPNVGESCSLRHHLGSTGRKQEEKDQIYENCFLITLSADAMFTPPECIRIRNTCSRVFNDDRDIICVLHLIGITGNTFKTPEI